MVKYFLGEADPTKPNISEGFEEKLPKVVDYFAKLYGEEYREQFSEKLNNCTYIFVNRPHIDKKQFSNLLTDNLFEYLKEQWNIQYMDDKNYAYTSHSIFNIASYWNFIIDIDQLKNDDKELYTETLQILYNALSLKREFNSFDEFIASDKLKLYIKKIQFYYRPFYLMANNYLYNSQLHPYCCPDTNGESFDRVILIRYFCDYFRAWLERPSDQENIYKFFSNEKLLSQNDKNNICETIKQACKKYYFTVLNDKNLTEQEFDYLKYDELVDTLNLRKFKEEAKVNLKIINGIAQDTLYELVPEFRRQLLSISGSISGLKYERNLYTVSKKDEFVKFLFDYCFKNTACAYVHTNDNENLNFCVLPQDSDNETVVHELGHVATSFGENKSYTTKCGLTYKYINNSYGYYLNEAITQRGALIIDGMMRDDGFMIGTDKQTNCPYNCMTGLVLEFVDSFSELLKAYNGSSFDELFDQIGEENFMRLDECFTKIYNLTKSFTTEEIDVATEYWQRIMHPETKHPFVRDMTHVNIAATVRNPSNEVMKEIKNLKEIYDDIVAYQKNAGVNV